MAASATGGRNLWLASGSVFVMGRSFRGARSANPESRDSGSGANAPSRNDGGEIDLARSLAVLNRSAGLLPGIDTACDMRGIEQARVLGGVDGHGRTLAEGAEEHDTATGRGRHLAQHAAGLQVLVDGGIGRMQRAGQRAVLGALASLAQIDQQNVGFAEARDGFKSCQRPALLGEIFLMQPDMHVRG